jgi:hypothetical protein
MPGWKTDEINWQFIILLNYKFNPDLDSYRDRDSKRHYKCRLAMAVGRSKHSYGNQVVWWFWCSQYGGALPKNKSLLVKSEKPYHLPQP